MAHRKIFHFTFVLVLLFSIKGFTQEDFIDFESDQWDRQGAEIVQFMDRKCLIGSAFLKDVEFENGVIEVDIAVSGQKARTYPGVLFRVQSQEDYERFYIRPHRASLYPDAIQYVPSFNGIDGWQLYNGENYTSAADIPDNKWVHFKLEVSGSQARLFMDDMDQPVFVMNYLKHGVSRGTIGLNAPRDRTAYFSNFTYRIDNTLKFNPVPEIERHPGIITNWQISKPFPFSQVDVEKHPDEQELGEIKWQEVTCEPSGMVDISRYYGRTGREYDCILAKATIHSDEEKRMQLLFGYSDFVTLFLNGKLMFYGSSVYQGRDPSFLGIMGYNDAVYLPLQKGENELLMWVVEAFGGWGFMAKDGNAVYEAEGRSQVWKIEKELRMPESALYDKKRNVIYVTNFDRFGAPGQQFISKVTLDGKIQQLKWVETMFLPTGMAIFKDRLFVVERRNIAEIDLETGKILNRLPLPQPMFPNDIAIDNKGNMFVSDSRKGAIYNFINGKFEEWLKGNELANINGLCIHKDKLICGITGDHSLKAVDLKTKAISTMVRFGEGIMDGIKLDQDGNFLISHYEGRIYRVTPSGQFTKLLYVQEERCADFEYIPENNLLVIPTLETSKLLGYKYENK
jgi:sugar lactone lactonase YvrE